MNSPLLTSEQLNALANLTLALAALIAGIWTVYFFWENRRLEAAKWLKQLFTEFYVETTFFRIRNLLEYYYQDKLGPLIERRITNRDISLTPEEVDFLRELDILLNYFEFILYLEQERHLSEKDRRALFEYWYDLLNHPSHGGLRRYIHRFGFERISKSLNLQTREYVVFYGSLMTGMSGIDNIDIRNRLIRISSCKIYGTLFDIGEYPGLVPGTAIVHAELHEVLDLSIFRELDAFERFYPGDDKSLYIRRCVRLAEPNIDAWVYFYNLNTGGKQLILSGSWEQYLENNYKP